MRGRLKAQLGADDGFTLIELLIVVQILAILLLVAVPTYLTVKDRASKTTAAANVRTLVDNIEQYSADNYPGSTRDPDAATSTTDSGYAGMTIAELKANYDAAIPATDWVNPADAAVPAGVVIPAPATSSYCAVSHSGRWYAWRLGAAATIKTDTVAANVCK